MFDFFQDTAKAVLMLQDLKLQYPPVGSEAFFPLTQKRPELKLLKQSLTLCRALEIISGGTIKIQVLKAKFAKQ